MIGLSLALSVCGGARRSPALSAGPLLLVPAPNLLDQDQIARDWRPYKIGVGSPP
jgi:hypothetical protein